ncbi:hypothetical protein JHK87_049942 [Glycine soja]|nr:hypothetical protein JHK87_049942 [Glycine soja]
MEKRGMGHVSVKRRSVKYIGIDEDILVELGEDARGEGVGGAPMDDLEVPPIDDDGGGGDAINEEEDYLHLTLNDLLGLT